MMMMMMMIMTTRTMKKRRRSMSRPKLYVLGYTDRINGEDWSKSSAQCCFRIFSYRWQQPIGGKSILTLALSQTWTSIYQMG